jgi:hypothetical protein
MDMRMRSPLLARGARAALSAGGLLLAAACPAVAQFQGYSPDLPPPPAAPSAPTAPAAAPASESTVGTQTSPASGHAQDIDLGAAFRIGTLGLGGEISKEITPNVALRVGVNGYTYNHTGTYKDVTYKGDLSLSNVPIFVDLYPSKHSSFHITPGFIFDSNKVTGNGQASGGTYTINNHTYTVGQVGTLTGNADFANKLAPYLGFGFGTTAKEGARVRFLFDIGAEFQGSARVHLNATGSASNSAALNAQLQTDVQKQQQSTQSSLNDFKVYPVVSLGLGIHF